VNFPKFQELVEKRSGFRTMESPHASGEYFSDSCGDMYTYYLKVGPGDVIEDVSYFTTGCGFGTATCSLLVELAHGKTLDAAYAISEADIENELDGYPEKKKDYPERSLLALSARPGRSVTRCCKRRTRKAAPEQRPLPARVARRKTNYSHRWWRPTATRSSSSCTDRLRAARY
jgi:NifU-like protein involved in Fe-S cluster formation